MSKETVLSLLFVMKEGKYVPRPVLADALRDEGLEEEAEWVEHRLRVTSSTQYKEETPTNTHEFSYEPTWWGQEWSMCIWNGGITAFNSKTQEEAEIILNQYVAERLLTRLFPNEKEKLP